MIERGEHLPLRQEPLAMQRGMLASDGEDLQRAPHLQLEMLGLVHDSHAAAAENTDNTIGSDNPVQFEDLFHDLTPRTLLPRPPHGG